jgi:hypothetical protein
MSSENLSYNLRTNPKSTEKAQERKPKPTNHKTKTQIQIQLHTDTSVGKDRLMSRDEESEMTKVGMDTDQPGEADEAKGDDHRQEVQLHKGEEREIEHHEADKGVVVIDSNIQILQLLQQLTESQNDKFNQLTESQNDKFNQLTESQNEKFKFVHDTIVKMEEKLTQKQEIFQEQIQTQITQIVNKQDDHSNQINILNEDLKKLSEETDNKLIKQSLELHDHVQSNVAYAKSSLLTELQGHTNHVMDNIRTQLENKIQTNSNGLSELNTKLHQVENQHIAKELEIVELKTQMEGLNNKLLQPNPNYSTGPIPIQVTCMGGSTFENLPTFNGRNKNPQEFLVKFEAYLRNTQIRQNQNIRFQDLLENCLQDSASRWWQMIKSEITSYEEFEKKYLDKYWNNDIQRGIKRRVETERYRTGGYLTRSEYFVERVMTLKQMTPTLEEEDIVNLLSIHFDQRIQDAIRVQNITGIDNFEKLLNREDIEERNNPPTHQSSFNNTNRKSQFERRPYPRPTHETNNQHQRSDHETNNYTPRQYQKSSYPAYNNYKERNWQSNYQRPQRNYTQRNNPQLSETYTNQHNQYPTVEQQRMCQTIQTNQPTFQPTYVYSTPAQQNVNQPNNSVSQNHNVRPSPNHPTN